MYHPSRACSDQVVHLSGFLWMRMWMPSGARCVQLKLYVPWICAHAESLGLIHEPCRRLRVGRACGRRQSQRWRGMSLSTLHRPAMK